MMSRVARALGALILAAACAACDADGDAEPRPADGETCRRVLGEEAFAWLERESGSDSLWFYSAHGVEEAARELRTEVKSWTPDGDWTLPFRARVCSARLEEFDSRSFGIYFEQSQYSVSEMTHSKKSEDIVFPLTPTAVAATTRSGPDRVFFECRVEGSHPDQEKDVPIMGVLTDRILKEKRLEDRYNALLHASRVMAEALGCQNDVQIPEKFPAAAK